MSSSLSTSSQRRPHLGLVLAEGRVVLELGSFLAAAPWLAQLPKGDGQAVLVLPGLLAGDGSTFLLRGFLANRGYEVYGWDLGRNLGTHTDANTGAGPAITARLHEIAKKSGRKVSLLGWSLGGLYARELARENPEMVRQVITMGSPFKGSPKANNAYRIFERFSGYRVSGLSQELLDRMGDTPPVPTTAIFSRSDGVTSWGCCVEETGPQSESIEVHGSHLGLGVNPLVAWAVADRLALPEGEWSKFERSGLRKAAFGSRTG